jgi:hypothetical protein
MVGELSVQAQEGMDKTGAVCERDHGMLSPLTNTSNLHYQASVSSFISTGHNIDCSFILEKELFQLTPVTLPTTMHSNNKTATVTAITNQHTAAMLTDHVRTPSGSLDPNSLSTVAVTATQPHTTHDA